uniref:Transcription initiation factor TFIID subunit 1 histone acetyltransferase domain-containing protein n=1 Tax=Plectus sambesii TaxID=2011161 RepID=A0A914V608_9BILA
MNDEEDASDYLRGDRDGEDMDDEMEQGFVSDADGEESNDGGGGDSDESEEEVAIKHLIEAHRQSNANIPVRWHDDDNDGDDEVEWEPLQSQRDHSDFEPFVPPAERDDAPLSGILNERIKNVDPRQFFPEFKIDKVLRFSRLFGAGYRSSSKAHIWWGAKTARKRTAAAAAATASGTSKGSGAASDEPQAVREAVASQAEQDSLQLDFAPPPPPDQCAIDDELRLMRPMDAAALDDKEKPEGDDESDIPPWRYGPARLWYDQMGVPSTGHGFDYGFKLRPPGKAPFPRVWAGSKEDKMYPPSTFLPVNLIRWEDNIIYDGEDIREEVIKKLTSGKQPICGWIPTQHTRTYESFMAALKSGTFGQMFSDKGAANPPRQIIAGTDSDFAREPGPNHSIFPMDNYDLVNSRWEDDVIWDSQNMEKIPEPKVLTLDFWDDPKIFGMPDDKAVDSDFHPSDSTTSVNAQGDTPTKAFDRKEHQFTKKSKMILGQVQQRQKQEEEEQLESSMAQMTDKDPFNMSNDEFYQPKNTSRQITSFTGGLLIQHSIPAQNIERTFFPTHINPFKLRHFHRLPLGKRHLRSVGGSRFNAVHSLTKFIQKQDQLREDQRAKEGGGEIFFMREVEDLSARDGDLVICEYSEEHPPLLQQPGMASKIRNYYKRKPGKEAEPQFDYGETAFTHTSPFLGNLTPGTAIQSLENNLYRAPIYQHPPNRNDFLIIKNKQGYFIRSCPTLFTLGQQCPLYEVPSPNSKRATLFVRDFLLAFIYRLFWASEHQPRRLKMEDIKAAFPHYAESSVRKRLKQCSDFKRLGQGPDQNYWVLRPDFRLPSKEEVLAMVTPEMCCAQYSMLAAEQRLKDAGYGEKYFFTPENEDDSDDQVTMEDEIKCAPWHTTRAYISAMKGKCLLDQTGMADR